MNRTIIRRNITTISIAMYIILYLLVVLLEPAFLYNPDGSLRSFGVGYRNKTVVPLWLVSLCLGIFCYYCVLYYLAFPKLIK